jgi:hypothetical protein
MSGLSVDSRAAQTFRVLPRKGSAFISTMFAAVFLLLVNSDGGKVTVNGRVVTGTERTHALNDLRLVFDPFLLVMLVWCGRRLLPESPFDHLEIRRNALIVRGLFGAKHLPWNIIKGFSANYIPLTRPPIVWITVRIAPADGEGDTTYRIGMGGYVTVRFNPFYTGIDDVAEIAAWLGRVKDAYNSSTTSELPAVPSVLDNSVIEMGTRNAPMLKRR